MRSLVHKIFLSAILMISFVSIEASAEGIEVFDSQMANNITINPMQVVSVVLSVAITTLMFYFFFSEKNPANNE